MKQKKSVFVALLGETNAGKSTFVNAVVGAKVSIVSHKVQTTRLRVLGIHSSIAAQIIFIDTPGIFTPKRDFDKEMIKLAYSQIEDADILAIIVDANKGVSEKTIEIIKKIPSAKKAIFIINKIDSVPKEILMKILDILPCKEKFDAFFMISALKKHGIEDILKYLYNNTVHDNWFYEEDQISDVPLHSLASEITREKIYKYLHQELPYNITVGHDSWKEDEEYIEINQTIYVAKASYKGMILGKDSKKIKQIRLDAMESMKKQFGKKIRLFLYIKVNNNVFNI